MPPRLPTALPRAAQFRPSPHLNLRPLHSTPPIRTSALENLFDTADRPSLFITKLNDKGFHLSDNLVVSGGLIILGGQPLLWNVDPPRDDARSGLDEIWRGWAKERFGVFEVVVPRPGESPLLLGSHLAFLMRPVLMSDRNTDVRDGIENAACTQRDTGLYKQSGNTARRHGLGENPQRRFVNLLMGVV